MTLLPGDSDRPGSHGSETIKANEGNLKFNHQDVTGWDAAMQWWGGIVHIRVARGRHPSGTYYFFLSKHEKNICLLLRLKHAQSFDEFPTVSMAMELELHNCSTPSEEEHFTLLSEGVWKEIKRWVKKSSSGNLSGTYLCTYLKLLTHYHPKRFNPDLTK